MADQAGEMRQLIGSFDWSDSPLGPRERWPAALAWSVELILASGFPMAVRWGPDLIQIYNDAYSGVLGEKHPQAFGRPTREIWPEIYGDLGPLSEAILRGERPGFFAEDHRWVIQRYGSPEEARFTFSYSPIPDHTAPNGIGGILVTVTETTKRVRNESRLRLLTNHLEAEVEQRSRERDRIWLISEDLLGVSNFDGYFTSVNPAWTRLLGWSEDEIKRMHVNELRHPEDAPVAIAARAELARGAPAVRVENRFRHRDGTWRWIQWTMTAYEQTIYVSGRHVTTEKQALEALQQNERQFRSLVEGVVDYAFIMLDPDGIVTSWNPGAERIKGYAAGEIIGRHFSQFYTETDRAGGLPSRSLAVAAEAGKFETESWRVRKDGTQFFASVVIDAIRNEKGELMGFAKITRDITERREAQAALQRAQAQLAQSQKMEALGQLTGGVAHDFNNLLMIVSGQAQSLLRKLKGEKLRRSLEAIVSAASRGETLTRQLLTFSRRQQLTPVAIDLRRRIDAVRDMLAPSLHGNIELVCDIEEAIWPVEADLGELELALVNIAVNARDAMPDGGTITLQARNVMLRPGVAPGGLAGEFVALAVADNGSGIAPDVLARVFEPFFTTKPVGKGTGLGLSQVHGFANQAGGTVTVTSDVGKGTAVTIYLPRSLAVVTDDATPSATPEPARGQGTVLRVEDSREVADVTTTMVEQLGYRVVRIDNAADALRRLEEGMRPDLLFSDIVMPGGINGIALAQACRERYPDIPVLLTTGFTDAAQAADGRFAILRKPFELAALERAVDVALRERRRERRALAG
jgi:PAS domain S-box-containing protein